MREKQIEEIYQKVNGSPPLLSLLYDLDLTPEECEPGSRKEAKMVAVVSAFSALEGENRRLREALLAAHHSLVALHNLRAFDGTAAYDAALMSGCDAEAAMECFLDSTFEIDEKAVIDQIDRVLSEGGGE
jgi:hypothetical protein